MSRGERWTVVAVGALFLAVGAWLILARPEPYAPSVVDGGADALVTPPESPDVGGHPVDAGRALDKKRHDELLALLRSMYADAGAVRPRDSAAGTAAARAGQDGRHENALRQVAGLEKEW